VAYAVMTDARWSISDTVLDTPFDGTRISGHQATIGEAILFRVFYTLYTYPVICLVKAIEQW
jgi:hypothetical protein